MPQLLTLFLFLPLISLACGQLSDSSVGAEKLLDDVEGVSNAIRKSSDGLLPTSRGKRSEGVYCSNNTVDVNIRSGSGRALMSFIR